MTNEKVILRTVHGSRLYGLHHADSDYDIYTVMALPRQHRRKVKQRIDGDDDLLTTTFSEFARQCAEGVPQALEALYSPIPEIDLIEEYRRTFVTNTGRAVARYRRAIRSFGVKMDTEKARRHALRLALNLEDILATGVFTPVLTEERIRFVREGAQLPFEEFVDLLNATSSVELYLLEDQ